MKQYKFFSLLMHKAYLDKGIYLLNYLKVFILGFALASKDVTGTFIFATSCGVLAYVVGRLWYHYKLTETENEINNIFNPFVKDVRLKLNSKA